MLVTSPHLALPPTETDTKSLTRHCEPSPPILYRVVPIRDQSGAPTTTTCPIGANHSHREWVSESGFHFGNRRIIRTRQRHQDPAHQRCDPGRQPAERTWHTAAACRLVCRPVTPDSIESTSLVSGYLDLDTVCLDGVLRFIDSLRLFFGNTCRGSGRNMVPNSLS